MERKTLEQVKRERNQARKRVRELRSIIDGLMKVIGELPSCAEDLLGADLYKRVQKARR